jgi:prevent-host-death family protein
VQKATISELKNRLSAYLDRVRAGETVLIYDRDRLIARLESIDAAAAPDEHLVRMERAGLVRRASTPVPIKLLRKSAPRSRRSVVQALIEERRDGR